MTRYGELCDAYFMWEPYQVEIDRIFRETPLRMRQAITQHLQPPANQAMLPTAVSGVWTPYIALFRKEFDRHGRTKWQICIDDDCLYVDADGIRGFIIGICLEKAPATFPASMMYFTFSIESVTSNSVDLKVENLATKISVDLTDDLGFIKAAETTIDALLKFLRDPLATRSGRIPIGFYVTGQVGDENQGASST